MTATAHIAADLVLAGKGILVVDAGERRAFVPEALADRGLLPGIQVDTGGRQLAGCS